MSRAVGIAMACTLAATVAVGQYKPKGPSVKVPTTQPGSPVQITPAGQSTTLASARRINLDEALKLLKEEKVVFVDVRSKESYDRGHIKGALSIPGSQLNMRLKEIPFGKTIVTYCA